MPDTTTGVVVIGGGSTGAGVLRDLSMRGIDAVLVEKGDLASGTTGRSHGLLHSGGRYCVNDLAAAIECVEEGRILRRIARTTTEVTGFIRDGNQLTGVLTRDTMTGEETSIGCKAVINATGAWAGFVARLLDVEVKVVPVKGVMVVLSHRVAHATINRCHKPGDGDIIVPALSVAILGTTAVKVPHPEVLPIEWDEVRHMIEEGSLMAEGVSTARAMRAYAGVRPLYDLGAEAEGREMSRNFAVIDHEQRDGIAGFTSIVGGKVTTYRLMAERVTDLVARRLGVTMPCATAGVPLNDREDELDQLRHRPAQVGVPKPHGDELALQPLVCECEVVRPQDVAPWFEDPAVRTLEDIRRRTRTGMGPCQAAVCSYRLAGRLVTARHQDGPAATRAMADLLETRWRGVRHVFWGSQLRQAQVTAGLHLELFNLDRQLTLEKEPSATPEAVRAPP